MDLPSLPGLPGAPLLPVLVLALALAAVLVLAARRRTGPRPSAPAARPAVPAAPVPDPPAPAAGGPQLVSEMVAAQMRTATATIYRVITYASLAVLLTCTTAFGAVQVWALRGYLPAALPAPAAWTLPVALHILVLAAELILLASAVTRSRAVGVTSGAVMAIGYGAEIGAHWHAAPRGGPDLLTITLIVMTVLLGLCWTLLALALRAGITDADAIVARTRHAQQTPVQGADQALQDTAHPAAHLPEQAAELVQEHAQELVTWLPHPPAPSPDPEPATAPEWHREQPEQRPAAPAAVSAAAHQAAPGRIDIRIPDQEPDPEEDGDQEDEDGDGTQEDEPLLTYWREGDSTRIAGDKVNLSASTVAKRFRTFAATYGPRD